MWSADVEARWRARSEEVITGMAEWRGQHPQATLSEIEAALDERLARVRARMLRTRRWPVRRPMRTTYDRAVTLRRS